MFEVSQSRLARVLAMGALALAAVWFSAAEAGTLPFRQSVVKAADGVELSVQEYGNPGGTPIVFVHGLLGSHLNWEAQVDSPALRQHHLITFDLRGHGQSGAPAAARMYTEGRRWADDLHAVVRATGTRPPVLVGWSLGAAVISNYLAAHGDAGIAGVVYVGGVVEFDAAQIAPHPDIYRDMNAVDLRTRLDAQRAFLSLCFQRPPADDTFQRLIANAALASAAMQHAVHRMTVSPVQGLARLERPMLQIYGEQDALVLAGVASQRARQLHPAIRTSLYEHTGHAPFIESPERFNQELAAFVDEVQPSLPPGVRGQALAPLPSAKGSVN